jgi:hypothetical protein
MDTANKQQAGILFEAYNKELARVYDEILDSVESEATLASADFQAYLETEAAERMLPFFAKELDGLTSGTPEAYFDGILCLEDALEAFRVAAQLVDGELPEHLMLRVGAFGEESSSRIMEMALEHDWTNMDGEEMAAFRDKVAVDLAALRVLGQWKHVPAIGPVLDRFCALDDPDEYVADGVKAFAVSFAGQIVPDLEARLLTPNRENLSGPYEYLVVFLTEIGRNEPSESIFQSLKNAFRHMEHKVIASICLGDYGDGRAIPLLKSYLDRHIREIDRQFFYETLSAIRRLGGDISDIQDPFRDFNTETKR